MNGVFKIVSCPKTIWAVVDCSVGWYVLRIAKAVASSIPDQGSSSFR